MLGKRSGADQPDPGSNHTAPPAQRVKIDEDRADQSIKKPDQLDPIPKLLQISSDQKIMIENELECHKLYNEIQVKKRELHQLYKRW